MRYLILFIISLLFASNFSAYADTMKLAYFDEYAPRSYKENGKMKGILIDIIDSVIADGMGIAVSHEGYPWSRAQMMVQTGEADAFVTVPTEKRREYTVVAEEPVLTFQTFVATAKDHPKVSDLINIKTIKELQGYKLVDYFGNGWGKSALKDQDVVWLPDYESIFTFLLQGKADAVVVSKKAIISMNKLGFRDKFTISENPLTSVQFNLCINKNSKFANIIDKFNKILKQKKEAGEIDKIIENYLD